MMTTGITQQRSLNTTSRRARLARWATPLVGAIAVTTVACGAQTPAQPIAGANGVVAAPQMSAQQPNANGQVMVNCGPGQQAMIRPVLMNGQAVSQVECVAAAVPVAQQVYAQPGYASPYAQPAAYPQAIAPVAAPQPTYVSYEPAPAPRVVRAPSNVRRTSNYRTSGDYVEYRKPSRDWTKSAVIIGSTAGIGAGVGAAAGGKKGALIGAAIGGGGAAIWDQVTRQKE
jgi:hypothetical protein